MKGSSCRGRPLKWKIKEAVLLVGDYSSFCAFFKPQKVPMALLASFVIFFKNPFRKIGCPPYFPFVLRWKCFWNNTYSVPLCRSSANKIQRFLPVAPTFSNFCPNDGMCFCIQWLFLPFPSLHPSSPSFFFFFSTKGGPVPGSWLINVYVFWSAGQKRSWPLTLAAPALRGVHCKALGMVTPGPLTPPRRWPFMCAPLPVTPQFSLFQEEQ